MSYGEIKKAVNSDLSKPLNTLIEEKTGAVNATGGTTTTGGIFAKLNKLLTDWTTARAGKIDNIDTNISALVAGKVVKSMQTGVVASTATGGTANTADAGYFDITIASVNPSKCLILFEGGGMNSATFDVGIQQAYTNVANKNIMMPYLTSSNNLRLHTWSTGSLTQLRVGGRWQVIEFY